MISSPQLCLSNLLSQSSRQREGAGARATGLNPVLKSDYKKRRQISRSIRYRCKIFRGTFTMSANLGTQNNRRRRSHLWKTTRASSIIWKSPTAKSPARKGTWSFRRWIIFTPVAPLKPRRNATSARRSDPKGWLEFLDDVGIEWTVLYPTVALCLRQDRQSATTP